MTLKPYTRYVCPTGHASHWTGAYRNPRPGDTHCSCGEEMVEAVEDGIHVITWEMIGPYDWDWRPARAEHRRSADAESQVAGLQRLAAEGEPIRNIELRSYDLIERGGS